MAGIYLPREDEMQGGDYALMPEDLYIVEVIKHKFKDTETPGTVMQPNPYDRTEEFPDGKVRPVLFVTFKAISFANQDPLVDENGEDVDGDKLFFSFLDTTKVGLKPRASNFRKFITAAFGEKPEASMSIEDWDELVGKRLIIQLKHNKGKHKVEDYSPLRTRRRAAASAAPAEAPAAVSDDAAIAAKAEEVFGEDVSF